MQSMSVISYLSRGDVFLAGMSTIVIIFAIVLTALVTGPGLNFDINPTSGSIESFSQVLTVGPVWKTDTWICTSDAEFIVHAVLIGYEKPSKLEIFVSGSGSQPDFVFPQNEMQSFSLGGPADSSIRITRSGGLVTGFLTLQTMSDATASCEQI